MLTNPTFLFSCFSGQHVNTGIMILVICSALCQMERLISQARLSWQLKLTSMYLDKMRIDKMINLCSRTFVFEVQVEGRKLLSMLDMCKAIASFLHLSFVFNLEYPGVKQVSIDNLTFLIFGRLLRTLFCKDVQLNMEITQVLIRKWLQFCHTRTQLTI